jgi:hypothetical protein
LNHDADRKIVTWIWVGLGSIGCGGVVFVLLFVGGLLRIAESRGGDVSEILIAVPPALIVLFGVFTLIGALIAGFRAGRDVRTGPTSDVECWIISRFAINVVGEMIFGNFEEDAVGGKIFVTIRLPNGETREMRAPWEVFNLCGEGMHGRALVQGSWICGFAPIARPAPASSNPYDPV